MGFSFSRLVVVMVLPLALTSVYWGYSLFLQDFAYTRARTELSFWGRDGYQPTRPVIQATGETLQALLQAAPRHPEILELQARYTLWQAYWTTDPDTRDTFSREVVEIQHLALLSRPAHRQGWSKMVEYASRARRGEVMLQLAQKRRESLLPPGSEGGLH